MISRIHNKLGTAGFVVAIVALVAALSGAAFAAGGGLNAKEKKEVKKIAKKFAGKNGKNGVNGTNGTNGAQGPKGDKGDKGDKGEKGDRGEVGPAGEAGMCSEAEPECSLASGATVAGVWAASGGEGDYAMAPISYPVRISPAPKVVTTRDVGGFTIGIVAENGATSVLGVDEGLATPEELQGAYEAACPGTAAAPEAAPGFTCIYTSKVEGVIAVPWELGSQSEPGHEFGVVLPFKPNGDEAYARGSWAATAA
jgi:Collagen triple helix repeat (20 copies)